jgi:hypothetical protein
LLASRVGVRARAGHLLLAEALRTRSLLCRSV